MSAGGASWVVCQLGAREHYAVARALAGQGVLGGLITEAWAGSGSVWARLSPRLAQRFHPGLAGAEVRRFTGRSLLFEAQARLRRQTGWPLIRARNLWFQRQSLRALGALRRTLDSRSPGVPPVLFSYSYTARELFRQAKALGWRTVLGQIDAGPAMQAITESLTARHPGWQPPAPPPPAEYWADWREECRLADRIVVNSQWVGAALAAEGVPAGKLAVVPLAYEPPAEAAEFQRVPPDRFTRERPLRVLFVGQVTLLKGIVELLQAARLMAGEPVEFTIVGPVLVEVPAELRTLPNVRWTGAVPRAETMTHYRAADVFLFPSHGDGFGLVQLEAQAWRLPVIASHHCGDVVRDGVNGELLPEVKPAMIAATLRQLRDTPGRGRRLTDGAGVAGQFRLAAVGAALLQAATPASMT